MSTSTLADVSIARAERWRAHRRSLMASLAPGDLVQEALARRIVRLTWRMNEAALDASGEECVPSFDPQDEKACRESDRREAHLDRSLCRMLAELRRLQKPQAELGRPRSTGRALPLHGLSAPFEVPEPCLPHPAPAARPTFPEPTYEPIDPEPCTEPPIAAALAEPPIAEPAITAESFVPAPLAPEPEPLDLPAALVNEAAPTPESAAAAGSPQPRSWAPVVRVPVPQFQRREAERKPKKQGPKPPKSRWPQAERHDKTPIRVPENRKRFGLTIHKTPNLTELSDWVKSEASRSGPLARRPETSLTLEETKRLLGVDLGPGSKLSEPLRE